MWQLASPFLLYLLALPLAAAIYLCFKRRSRLKRFVIPFSRVDFPIERELRRARLYHRLLFAALLASFALLIVAAARPFRSLPQAKRQGESIDILITLDVSESMDATDLVPSRIVAAKKVIRDFILRRPDDRLGLVVFSGEAVTKCPLTQDHSFLLSQVDSLELRELKQGTAVGMGLTNAIGRLRGSKAKSKVLILLSDGDSNVGAINPITATRLAKQEGIKIYTIGIGQSDRVVVPLYSYDALGRRGQLVAQVPSYLNPKLLADIARLTGAKSYMARDTDALGKVLQDIDTLERTKVSFTRLEKTEELFVGPAFLALLLALTVFTLQETRFRRMVSYGTRTQNA